ncbi:putative CRISPR-associated protein [Caldivirga sp. UBA161]|uniref:putative CRISPR-associated protein n=1 Tax=Caldivirga sp. UBA161 TaxID=1915569 RepID=UPI0025BCE076|nr:putative CRISPR-associated protein [Caldivirga sp. UBA161]
MSYKFAVLSTVGTSVLSNVEKNAGKLKSSRARDLFSNRSKPPSRLPVDDELQELFRGISKPGNEVFDDVFNLIKSDPLTYSAELNTIVTYLNEYPAKAHISEVLIILYPTDTGNSIFSSGVIKHYIESEPMDLRRRAGLPNSTLISVDEPVVLRGFGKGIEWFRVGLMDLMDKFTGRIIELRERGYRVVVNPTGGFKPESAYLTLIAMLAGAWRIIYSHESFREVVELPTLPVVIDPKYKAALSQIAQGMSRGTLKELGVDVNDLEDKGLIEVGEEGVHVKEWVIKLLELIK